MSRLALPLAALLFLAACPEGETTSPETAAAAEPAAEEPPKEVSADMIATYQGMASDVYSRDYERCLEEQMAAEDTLYMRAAFSMHLELDAEGAVTGAKVNDMLIKVRNYEGQDLADGNADAMGECLTGLAKEWAFEPAPGTTCEFDVSGSVGD
ncbi:MAG: hypothetical protein B7733_10030 [Myxococcales bacterium FL481]|nr:MAG: hypothetical protein B7733_10030 [Myxococcales bacterium FL481]